MAEPVTEHEISASSEESELFNYSPRVLRYMVKEMKQTVRDQGQELESRTKELRETDRKLVDKTAEVNRLKVVIIDMERDDRGMEAEIKNLNEIIDRLVAKPFRQRGKGKERRFLCNNCDKEARRVSKMLRHNEICNPQSLKFKCKRCPRRFISKRDKRRHNTVIHLNKKK